MPFGFLTRISRLVSRGIFASRRFEDALRLLCRVIVMLICMCQLRVSLVHYIELVFVEFVAKKCPKSRVTRQRMDVSRCGVALGRKRTVVLSRAETALQSQISSEIEIQCRSIQFTTRAKIEMIRIILITNVPFEYYLYLRADFFLI